MATIGKIVGVNGNLIRVAFDGAVAQNEVGFAKLASGVELKSEVIRIRGDYGHHRVCGSHHAALPGA